MTDWHRTWSICYSWCCTFQCDFRASKIHDFEYSWCTDSFRIQLPTFTLLLKFSKVLVPFYHYRWCLNIWKEVIFLSFFVFLWLAGIYTLFSLKIIKEMYYSGRANYVAQEIWNKLRWFCVLVPSQDCIGPYPWMYAVTIWSSLNKIRPVA